MSLIFLVLWTLVYAHRRVTAAQRTVKMELVPLVRTLSQSAVSLSHDSKRLVNRMARKDHSVRTYDSTPSGL